MRILIIGALGDIGSEATRQALADGHSVIALDTKEKDEVTTVDLTHPNISYVKADATNFEQVLEVMKSSKCEGVITLAAVRNPADYLVIAHNTNVVITWNALRAAAEAGVTRVAQASSVNVVGAIFNETAIVDFVPMDETHPCRPDEPYGLSKQILEIQGEAIVRRFPAMRVSSIRTHWALHNHEFHRLIAMTDYDSSKQLWGWTEIGACARAFLLAITSSLPTFQSGHEAFFVISPKVGANQPTQQLIDKWWPNVERRKTFAETEGLFDCSKAERLLGWVHDLPEASPEVEVEPLPTITFQSVAAVAPLHIVSGVEPVEHIAGHNESIVSGPILVI